jgi:hypothetical protein
MFNMFLNFSTTRSLLDSTVIMPASAVVASGSLSLTAEN